jgi:uncharacterized membrane-anchored protein
MSLLDRIRYRGAPRTPEEADALALRQLAGRGANLSKPRHVIHFLYFDTEADARAASEAIGDVWRVTVEPPGETRARWCVRADGDRIVGRETVAGFRAWFEGIAEAHGGEYDGWEAAAKP